MLKQYLELNLKKIVFKLFINISIAFAIGVIIKYTFDPALDYFVYFLGVVTITILINIIDFIIWIKKKAL